MSATNNKATPLNRPGRAPAGVVDLVPHLDASGIEVWEVDEGSAGESSVNTQRQAPTLTVSPDGKVTNDTGEVLSTVPRQRMASGSGRGRWDRIIQSIQEAENGRHSGEEVVVRPGGALELVAFGQAGQQLSRVPKDRMAATPRPEDEAELDRLDPCRVERWRFVNDPVLPGYVFSMRPVATVFEFFTFRWVGGRWYLSPLAPAFDTLPRSHATHVLSLHVGGDDVPVVCSSPDNFDHINLSEVRGTAAKFALFHSLGGHGYTAFSA